MEMIRPLIKFLILIALASLCSAQSDGFCWDSDCCQGVSDTTSLGDWNNCTIYYICFGSAPTAYSCPGGEYNPETNKCEASVPGCSGGTRSPIDSTSIPTTTTGPGVDGNCTEPGSYFVPYPGDCQKFMVCAEGTLLPNIEECPPGTLFDPDIRECNIESNVQCKPVCPDSEVISLPHDRNCTLYWFCSGGQAELRSCPPGTLFDVKFRTCNIESAVFCPNLCPPEGTVNLPNPNNCSLYWLCTLGIPTQRSCLEGLLFDPSIGQCNLASEVQCDVRHRAINLGGTFSLSDEDFELDEDEDYDYFHSQRKFVQPSYGNYNNYGSLRPFIAKK